MTKDPREGLRLRLGYEVAREIEKTPVIAPGVSDTAIRAANSVLFQRLQGRSWMTTLPHGFWKSEFEISTSRTSPVRTT